MCTCNVSVIGHEVLDEVLTHKMSITVNCQVLGHNIPQHASKLLN